MNPDLQQLQTILRMLSYLLAPFIAGELDEPRRAAIRLFQRTHRLPVSGGVTRFDGRCWAAVISVF
jgi:peptidoglycan hydrolase-like protein with peptidoglycan-binding domain